MHDVTPCLWFDGQAEEAANFYVSVFPNSKITNIARNGDAGAEQKSSVMVVGFELDGRPFVGLNGGPMYTFTEAVSFQVFCDTQDRIDYFWDRLSDGGREVQCGWLKDRYGLSWQIVPRILPELMSGGNAERAKRVAEALYGMVKLDIAGLRRAYDG